MRRAAEPARDARGGRVGACDVEAWREGVSSGRARVCVCRRFGLCMCDADRESRLSANRGACSSRMCVRADAQTSPFCAWTVVACCGRVLPVREMLACAAARSRTRVDAVAVRSGVSHWRLERGEEVESDVTRKNWYIFHFRF